LCLGHILKGTGTPIDSGTMPGYGNQGMSGMR
jgi:hypothetical protein